MRISVTVNRSQVSAKVSAGTRRVKGLKRGLARGIVKAANFLLDRSREIVPIDTKDLYNSSRVEQSGAGEKKVADVTYNMPYGLYVHEDLNKKHKPGKTAKFLERPARQYRPEMRAIVEKETTKR